MPIYRTKHHNPVTGVVLMIAGVVLPAALAVIPFSRISVPAIIIVSVLCQTAALIFGIRNWQRTQGKITACAAATLLLLIGLLIVVMLYTHDRHFDSISE